eukprot:9724345-Karenia_brevis.AAC.1
MANHAAEQRVMEACDWDVIEDGGLQLGRKGMSLEELYHIREQLFDIGYLDTFGSQDSLWGSRPWILDQPVGGDVGDIDEH